MLFNLCCGFFIQNIMNPIIIELIIKNGIEYAPNSNESKLFSYGLAMSIISAGKITDIKLKHAISKAEMNTIFEIVKLCAMSLLKISASKNSYIFRIRF